MPTTCRRFVNRRECWDAEFSDTCGFECARFAKWSLLNERPHELECIKLNEGKEAVGISWFEVESSPTFEV